MTNLLWLDCNFRSGSSTASRSAPGMNILSPRDDIKNGSAVPQT